MGMDLLIARLKLFLETSEEMFNAVTATLVCFQNMGEVDPRVLTALSEHPLLVPWLVDRIYVVKNRKFDENKGIAAELLATLAQVRRHLYAHVAAMACLSCLQLLSLVNKQVHAAQQHAEFPAQSANIPA